MSHRLQYNQLQPTFQRTIAIQMCYTISHMFGSTELIIIVVVVLVLFGSAAVPKFARSLGQAKSEFEKGLKKSTESDTTDSDKQKLS